LEEGREEERTILWTPKWGEGRKDGRGRRDEGRTDGKEDMKEGRK